LSETKEVEQEGYDMKQMGPRWLERCTESLEKLAGKQTDETTNLKLEKHLFLDLTLEEDSIVVTAPFWVIQRPVDIW
jgi:hypothetical protein